ncbi:MAG: sterol desaturase family protein [Hydrogenophaga sp.]|uniref:sterol desaturase family protein n=1 Tax=Hydrogenophaga sp. TaxID=1904254 RepID=UPI00277B3F0B|nr:sterol desaturase family protein [Hydrogenophaga sp.]MDP2417124.1 sterol desaturase family protein [Hydrogenophaga sp.]MDZ4187730.1 sterol desaturase family protein [Hydrogenophaga sp.]
MNLLNTEHSPVAYATDFVLYGAACLVLLGSIVALAPVHTWGLLAGWALLGLLAWTALEYALHRFVLHGLQPFSRWHNEHHRRPEALISTPTLVSAGLFMGLVYLPALFVLGPWPAAALTLGLLVGYLWYSTVHHAIHHWTLDTPWLRQRKRWHAEHHHVFPVSGFGVTTRAWDNMFRAATNRWMRG